MKKTEITGLKRMTPSLNMQNFKNTKLSKSIEIIFQQPANHPMPFFRLRRRAVLLPLRHRRPGGIDCAGHRKPSNCQRQFGKRPTGATSTGHLQQQSAAASSGGAALKSLNFTTSNTVKGNINAANSAQVNIGGVDLGGGKSNSSPGNLSSGTGGGGFRGDDGGKITGNTDGTNNNSNGSSHLGGNKLLDILDAFLNQNDPALFDKVSKLVNEIQLNIHNSTDDMSNSMIDIAFVEHGSGIVGQIAGAITAFIATGDPTELLSFPLDTLTDMGTMTTAIKIYLANDYFSKAIKALGIDGLGYIGRS